MDVTVVMTEAATTPGFALDYAFGNKRRTARPKQLPLPSVAESLCGWHNGAKREVKKSWVLLDTRGRRRVRPYRTCGEGWHMFI